MLLKRKLVLKLSEIKFLLISHLLYVVLFFYCLSLDGPLPPDRITNL